MKRKKRKEPTKQELLKVFYSGIVMMSFGMLFIWIPLFGIAFLGFGAFLVLVVLLTAITKMIK